MTIFDEMEKSDKYFIEDDYKINFIYSKKMYPLLGKSNLELIKIISSPLADNLSDETIENIKMTLFISNLKLVNYTIRTYFSDFKIEKEELVNIGIEGLYDAINNFNYYAVNSNFTKYAIISIRNSIRKNFRQISNIPYYLYYRILEFYKTKRNLEQSNLGRISTDEILNMMGIAEKDINKLFNVQVYRLEYHEQEFCSKEDEIVTIAEKKLQGEILEKIFSLFDETKIDILLNLCNYTYPSLNKQELAKKYNIQIKTVENYFYTTKLIIKNYFQHRDDYIYGNDYLYEILLNMMDTYNLKLSIEESNSLFMENLYYIDDINKVIDMFNNLVNLILHHKSRDAKYLTLECFKKHNMLLDVNFTECFMNKLNWKIESNKKKKNKLG